ncbi:hypothetical protein [Streptomyces sp. GQFP]|uniref:hypothetical protein n=1 Tax=Streptomyces sp. GQFP TaxID=2907545 RepID=UPI001F4614CA|nr:hypothetical protein [Streptomyces sp. GQFP]UIX34122.1 hypothetical protein LUX31_31260 [Streptomyces sp. GQFP]
MPSPGKSAAAGFAAPRARQPGPTSSARAVDDVVTVVRVLPAATRPLGPQTAGHLPQLGAALAVGC